MMHLAVNGMKRGRAWHGPLPSIFARQEDGLVLAEQLHARQREVREGDVLHLDLVTVAVLANERGAAISMHGEGPDLKPLGGHLRRVALRERDGVEQPVGATMLGHIARTVCVEDG